MSEQKLHVSEKDIGIMASPKFSMSVTIEDVTTDSSTTEDEKGRRPSVRSSDGTQDQENSHSVTDGGKSAETSSAEPRHLKPNGSASAQSSPSSKRHSSRRDGTPPLDEPSLLLAATLVLDAKAGRNLAYGSDEKHVRSYIQYHKFYFRYLLYFFIMFDLLLALFENPAMKGAELPYWITMLMEVVCLLYFTFRKMHVLHFQEKKMFLRDTKNYMVIGTIILTVIDMITYIIWINLAPDTNPVRWSRPLRPLFIINFSDGKQIRRAFRNIRRTVPEIIHVLVLFFLCVFLFGLMGLKLFYKRPYLVYPNGDPYFKSYFDAVWDLYVLVTTANNPDVMMPAYDYDNWFVLYFGVYLVINLYIFMSIVLASIYYNYKKNLKNEIKTAVYSKRHKLAQAFDILKVDYEGKGTLTRNRWMQLMEVVVPHRSQAQSLLLMEVLDINGDTFIYQQEFMNLADLLHVELTEVKDRQTYLEKHLPHIYNTAFSYYLKLVIRHRYFRYSFDLLIFVNAFFIGFDVDEADWFFLVMFTLEIILKLYVYGPQQFTERMWNIFDFLVIGAAVIATIIEAITGESNDEFSTLDILLVLRVLRLFKLFGSITRFKIIIQTIINIGPSIATYGGVIFVFYYFFAIIGMELFQHKISYHGYNESTTMDPSKQWCGNAALQNSTFYQARYCSNNFNDLVKSLVLLLELTVVNQWHVLTSGFVLVSGSKWVRLYFFSFHLCCVVLVLNIFTAFILEAYILEYSLRTAPKLETAVEAKIKQLGLGIGMKPKRNSPPTVDELELVSEEQPPAESDEAEDDYSDTDSLPDLSMETGLRFHLKKRTRKKTEVLLQQMFQSEIDEEDVGPDDLNEGTIHHIRQRKLTLDDVA